MARASSKQTFYRTWVRAVALGEALLVGLLSVGIHANEFDNVDRIIAVGDIHGAYSEFHRLLLGIGVIDDQDQWRAGNTHLVSLGDLLDRGPDSRKVMDLLMQLQYEAMASGGRVHVVLGNHELMNLTGDTRDVSDAEYAAFGGEEQHAAAFSSQGEYGSWLLRLPFAIRINDSLFMHGGVSSGFSSVADVNKRANTSLSKVLSLGKQLTENGVIAPGTALLQHIEIKEGVGLPDDFINAAGESVLGANGPLWYRGNAGCHPLIEGPRLSSYLARLGVRRVVVGHTPTPEREVVMRLQGKVYVIDTGMLHSVYRGNARALELNADGIRALTEAGLGEVRNAQVSDAVASDLVANGNVETDSDNGWQVRLGDQEATATFTVLSAKKRNRAIAAYRLDRTLGLGFVPPVAAREVDGEKGLVSIKRRIISERERSERGLLRPTYCEQESEYGLVAAFDSLVGKLNRGLDNLAYDPGDWSIVLTDNNDSFPTSARLPSYQQPPILASELARRLELLDEPTLDERLGDLLKRREIKGILKRRDAIVRWPRHGE